MSDPSSPVKWVTAWAAPPGAELAVQTFRTPLASNTQATWPPFGALVRSEGKGAPVSTSIDGAAV